MILDLPPELETIIAQTAKAQGISAQELALATLQKSFVPDEEQAYYDWFCEHFDIERLDKAINSPSVEVPKSALKDLASFERFLKESFA